MDQHPIPQDVTGFQFKLIGNMTIKQFLYLASGSVLAWIAYALPLPIYIKLPFVALFGMLGFSLAFLPLEGRPLDTMCHLFIKAVFSPNQYIYRKKGGTIISNLALIHVMNTPVPQKPVQSGKKEQLARLLQDQTPVLKKADTKEEGFLDSPYPHPTPTPQILSSAQAPEPPKTQADSAQAKKISTEEHAKQRQESIKKEALLIKQALEEAKKQETQNQPSKESLTHEKITSLEKELQKTLQQKEQLEQDLIELQKKLGSQKQVFSPSQTETPDISKKTQTARVKTIPKTMARAVGLMTPEVANVLTGIIKDARGNVLQNILIEVKTPDGDSVRAFKTNILGQFASAMPLSDGTYTVEFTDPQNVHSFDAIELIVQNDIILPLEITSIDQREELRKSLFKN